MADSLTNEAKYLSGRVYHNSKYTRNLGYETLGKEEDLGNGFYAEAYFKNGKIIIAYRGTDENAKIILFIRQVIRWAAVLHR